MILFPFNPMSPPIISFFRNPPPLIKQQLKYFLIYLKSWKIEDVNDTHDWLKSLGTLGYLKLTHYCTDCNHDTPWPTWIFKPSGDIDNFKRLMKKQYHLIVKDFDQKTSLVPTAQHEGFQLTLTNWNPDQDVFFMLLERLRFYLMQNDYIVAMDLGKSSTANFILILRKSLSKPNRTTNFANYMRDIIPKLLLNIEYDIGNLKDRQTPDIRIHKTFS